MFLSVSLTASCPLSHVHQQKHHPDQTVTLLSVSVKVHSKGAPAGEAGRDI